MHAPSRSPIERSRLTPLAACLAAMFALAAPEALALTVSNCNDHGSGSLRAAVGAAASGDTIDVSALGCGVITLTTGGIQVTVDDLTLQGPGADKLAITGKNGSVIETNRIIDHQAPDPAKGTLTIKGLTIEYGDLVGRTNGNLSVAGGCIYSNADVVLNGVVVANCTATSASFQSRGGGIYTLGGLGLMNSTITGNTAHSSSPGGAGGGVWAENGLLAKYSTISNNATTGTNNYAGGVFTRASVLIQYSTISGNTAHQFGGLEMSYSAGASASIYNSTISGNSATTSSVAGVATYIPLTLRSSTIAFNATKAGLFGPGGLAAYGSSSKTIAVDLESSIIANNTHAGAEYDYGISLSPFTTLTGANNLIVHAGSNISALTQTITACPLLGPLRDNGGPTMTHALLSHSPAIAMGNNTGGFADDQRFTGYLRISTGETIPDIGAYEVQQGDIIFNAGFDGCPPEPS